MRKEEQTEFEKKVLDQFMSGKNLFGKGGAFAPMLKNVIEKAEGAFLSVFLATIITIIWYNEIWTTVELPL